MNLQALKRSLDKDDNAYRLLDETLYRLCRDHSRHADRQSVYAKLWLIGRGYSTGIERQIKSNGYMGGSMTMLAEEMLKHANTLDGLVAELKEISEPLSLHKAEQIVRIHGRFINAIRKPMRPRRSPRSFTSKYLHFHCSAVPILDSFAALKLTKLVPWKDATEFPLPKEADPPYAWYVMRFITLYAEAQRQGLRITVKKMDSYLIAAD